MRKKCGASPAERQKKCPPLKQGRSPDNADCQGCDWGVEVGIQPGYPATIAKSSADYVALEA